MSGFNRNIAIVVGGLLFVVVVIVVVLVVRRGMETRVPAPVSPVTAPGDTETDGTDGGVTAPEPSEPREVNREAIMKTFTAPTDIAICGNGVCDRGESTDDCFIDCVERDIFDDVRSSMRGGTYIITWTTTIPMTTKAEIGRNEGSYGLAMYEDETLKTEHTAEFTDLEPRVIYHLKLSGQDSSGRTRSIEGHKGGFE
jgi:hypothetical protein